MIAICILSWKWRQFNQFLPFQSCERLKPEGRRIIQIQRGKLDGTFHSKSNDKTFTNIVFSSLLFLHLYCGGSSIYRKEQIFQLWFTSERTQFDIVRAIFWELMRTLFEVPFFPTFGWSIPLRWQGSHVWRLWNIHHETESPGTWMLYSGPEEIDACPTADTQGHQFPVLRTGKSDALSDARAPEKKPVIVNWTTKSSVRSQRDKTAFLPIIWPFWPSSRFTEKEKSINNPVAALMRRKTCFFGYVALNTSASALWNSRKLFENGCHLNRSRWRWFNNASPDFVRSNS